MTTAASRQVPLPAPLAALAGIVAGGVALGIGELVAGLLPGAPSPLVAVGATIIELAPPGSKDLMVSLFGTNDKLALTIAVAAVVLAIGALIGVVGRTHRQMANAGIVGLVALGFLAALRDPTTTLVLAAGSTAVQAYAGTSLLGWLLGRPVPAGSATGAAATAAAAAPGSRASPTTSGVDRRGFLVRTGVLGLLAVAGGWFGRTLLEHRAAATAAVSAEIPKATDPVAPPATDNSLAVDGITPLIVPNDAFYRIDTALLVPSVDVASWQLQVHGMVEREVTLTFDELVQLPLIERYVTIACVSNEVGGSLVGNTKWTGVRLMDVLDMAGVKAGATQIVPRSVDGWTAGFPTAWVTDPAHPRDAMIAVKMDDEPLPVQHGFPARLIVPGLYGYVSATKWLSDIELTTLEAVDAYWVPRGWAKEAPILTQSRIDVPHGSATVPVGSVPVAGVAWAPDRGISKVEVSVDGGAWNEATLSKPLSAATWVQWLWTWPATAGDHFLEVRATDGTGEVQTADHSRPDPDGARGHHTVQVHVS